MSKTKNQYQVSIVSSLTDNAKQSFVDNLIRDKISEPEIGSVVYCDLMFTAEHSGIYIGNNKIVHLNGDGRICAVDPARFLSRINGYNNAISIYTSCRDKKSVGSKSAANLAEKMTGNSRQYNVILDNCHQFTAGCLSGNFENPNNFLWMLKDEASKYLDANEWRVWDI